MKFWKRMVLLASMLGPGIITANIDNDASGITTYSVAGARFGYGLLWTLIPTTVALVVIQEMVARMGVITGKGLSHLIREHYGVKTTFYLMLGLLIANFGTTVANFAGWAASIEILGLSKYILVPAGAVIIWMLVTKGSYRAVERVLLGACLIYLGYIVSGILSEPDWGAIARETVMPRVPWHSGYVFLGIAVVGTTITPWMQFYLQSSIVEKGVKPEHYRATRLDVVAGSLFTNVISFFIIVTCGTLLFPHGIRIQEASEAAIALRPLAGDRSYLIFAVSLANASLLGAIVVPLATAYYVCEAMGWETGISKTFKEAPQFMWIYTLTVLLSALLILVPGAPLVSLMILSSAINGLLLPFVLVCALFLVNNRRLMGAYTNPRGYNYIAWGTVAVIIGLAAFLLLTAVIPAGSFHG